MPPSPSIRTRRPQSAGPLAALLAPGAALLLAAPAHAQVNTGGIGFGNILPNYGVDATTGDLRSQLESFLNPNASTVAHPAFLITPSIDGSIGATDNALRVQTPRRADLFTVIAPAVTVTGDTRLLQVNLSYNPNIVLYAQNSSQNQVYQYFNGQALGTIVPDAVFIDLRGNITESSLTGGFNQPQSQSLNPTTPSKPSLSKPRPTSPTASAATAAANSATRSPAPSKAIKATRSTTRPPP